MFEAKKPVHPVVLNCVFVAGAITQLMLVSQMVFAILIHANPWRSLIMNGAIILFINALIIWVVWSQKKLTKEK